MDFGTEPTSPAPPPTRLPLLRRLLAVPATTLFFAACLVVFFLAERSGSTTNTETLLRFGATWRGAVWDGEWWRLGTSMFLHIGVVHLVWNLWAGFSWSEPFERAIGSPRFAVVYLLSGIAGSAASVIGHDAVSAGASGALFGVVGGALVLQRLTRGRWKAIWNDPAQRRNLVTMAIWLAAGPFMNFDSFAHGGGLVAGAGVTWALVPKFGPVKLAVVLLGLAVLVGASLRPLPGLS
jgi:rhomboid protease GluP